VISATVDVCEVACRLTGLFWEHSAEIQRLKKASSITHGHHALKEWLHAQF
jgi:hypothetical protein